jgi:hypothetical protein
VAPLAILPTTQVVRVAPLSAPATLEVRAVSTLGGLGANPNPDDPSEPRGPGAPVIRGLEALVAGLSYSPDGDKVIRVAQPSV